MEKKGVKILKFRKNANFLKGSQKFTLWEEKQTNWSKKNINYLRIQQGGIHTFEDPIKIYTAWNITHSIVRDF